MSEMLVAHDVIRDLRAALAKAEAERDEARIELQHLKLATLAALTKAGLARERDSERARAEKYLAAMTALVETDGTDAEWLAPLAAIRALVEEVPRG